jgi:hypothetical protein
MAEDKIDGRTKAGRAIIKSEDVEQPKASTIIMEGKTATDDIERPDLIVVTDEDKDSPVVKEYMSDLKFMEDILTVSIGETTDKNAEKTIGCGVNGERKMLERGKEYKIARKFVDSLIKREDAIRTINYKDNDGVDQTRIEKVPALKYPLSIIHDPAGETGRRWFQHQCKNNW